MEDKNEHTNRKEEWHDRRIMLSLLEYIQMYKNAYKNTLIFISYELSTKDDLRCFESVMLPLEIKKHSILTYKK